LGGDVGLAYLARGARPSARDLQAFRDAHALQLQDLCARVLQLLAESDVRRLGRLRLAGLDPSDAAVSAELARELVEESVLADRQDEADLGPSGSDLPPGLRTRAKRRQTFQEARSGRRPTVARAARAPGQGASPVEARNAADRLPPPSRAGAEVGEPVPLEPIAR